jgi:release factor glutamine methyltransferase
MTDDLLISELPPRRRLNRLANQFVERSLHVLGYWTLLRRPGTRIARAAGFELTINPTVYDPRYHRAPLLFAKFIATLDLSNKRVADLGTGSGIQSLAACRAGATTVVAIDVNPHAAITAAGNAHANGFKDRVVAVASNLFSAIRPGPQFDVILTNPPFCGGPAWDVADRAWRAGDQYEGIASLFEQARERLRPNGVVYLILSSQSDLEFVGALVRRAGFGARIAAQQRVFLETLIIYELRPV